MENIVLVPADIREFEPAKPNAHKYLEYALVIMHQSTVITKPELGEISGIIDHTAVEVVCTEITVVLFSAVIIIYLQRKFIADGISTLQVKASTSVIFYDPFTGIAF